MTVTLKVFNNDESLGGVTLIREVSGLSEGCEVFMKQEARCEYHWKNVKSIRSGSHGSVNTIRKV